MTKSALPKFLAIFFTCLITWSNADVGFIKNEGQWHKNVLYRASIPMGHLYLEETGITYMFWDKQKLIDIHDNTTQADQLNYHVVKVVFEGANTHAATISTEPSEDYYNFYLGDDPSKWASGLHSFGKIEYKNIYPNIDLVIDALPLNFKYSFVVHPGGNVNDINLRIDGANDVLLSNGDIIITTTLGDIVEEAPYSFQGSGPEEIEIPTSFKLQGQHLSFDVSEYDAGSTLTIDPNVVFSSLSGSTVDNWGFTATYDDDGNAYSGGTVYGQNYGASFGAFSRFFSGGSDNPTIGEIARDCGIFKLNANGTQRIYTTFLGGVNNEQPHSLVVNENDELVVFGTTLSGNFPNRNAAQPLNRGGWDMFVTKFSSDGRRLIAGTFLGGTGVDGINGSYEDYVQQKYQNITNLVWNYGDIYRGEVTSDNRNYVYIASTTESNNFPTPGLTFDGTQNGQQDAVVLKLSPGLDTIVWASFLGGSADDAAYSLDLDEDRNVYVTGGTKGGSFPTSQGAYNRSYSGGVADGFVAKIDNDGQKLLKSTLIGSSSYDQSYFIKVGPEGTPWIYGQTGGSFPTKGTSGNQSLGMFITQFNKDLDDIKLSRIFGARGIINLSPSAFTVDLCGRIYVSGWGGNDQSTGNTLGLQTRGSNAQTRTDGADFYMAVYTEDLASVIFGTYFGGFGGRGEHVDGGTSRFDKRGIIYQAICAACGANATQFPTTPNAWGEASSHDINTNCNNAIVKIDLEGPAIYSEFEHTEVVCQVPQTISFTNFTQDATDFTWIMGDGKTYTDSNVIHTYTSPGTYEVKLIAYNPIACNLRDTFTKTLEVYAEAQADFTTDIDVCKKEVTFKRTGNYGRTFQWDFGDNQTSSSDAPTHTYNGEGTYHVKLTADGNTDCEDTFSLFITLEDPLTDFDVVLDTCNKTINTQNKSKGYESFEWVFGDGNNSNQLSPNHEYAGRGKYDLLLRTNIGTECEDTQSNPIEILDPLADFDLEIDTCLQVGRLTNNSLDAQSYKWDFGFATSTEGNPTVDFPKPDTTYTISLVAAPFSACSDTGFLDFRMPNLPEALFDDEADTCVSGTQFTNNSKDAPNWIWYFGNGDSSRAENPFYNYRDTGDFIVTLIAYPNTECSDTFIKLIEIDTFRFALFDVLLDTCKLEISFVNKSQSLDSFSWNFDDGNTGFGKEPTHQYNKDGDYFINLYGLNSKNNCEDSFEQAIFIPALPEPGNERFNDSCINTYIFKDTSKFGVSAKWFSSKGDTTVGPEFTVNFPKEGDYTVWQVSESLYGCTDTLEIPIRIDSIPTARFESTIDSCIGAIITSDNSIGQFRSFWTFGDGNTSRQLSPIIDYEQEGEYTLTLIINQGTECEDTIQETFLIEEYQSGHIFVPNVFTPNGDGINDVFEVGNLRPDCDEYHLFIYNRWGSLVHQDDGILDPWDGKTTDQVLRTTDKLLAPGTYFYVLKGLNITKSGSITIIH